MTENKENTIQNQPHTSAGKKSKKALVAYLLFLAVLVISVVFILRYAWNSLTLYEASRPEYVMESIVASLSENGFASLSAEHLSFHPLEPAEDYFREMENLISAYGISYAFLKENFSDGSLLYGLYSGDRSENMTQIAEVSLLPESSESRLYILNITHYVPGEILPCKEDNYYNVTVTLPGNVPVLVNGITPGAEFITEAIPYDHLTYCEEYVSLPEQVTYSFANLTRPCSIMLGAEEYRLSPEEADENGNFVLALDFTDFSPREMPEDLQRYVLDSVETYSNYFSRDLEGCRESIDPIRHLFPEDSVYLTLADQYRREDMGVFSSHTNTHFLNESVTEYTVYTEDCFSCRISYDKSMTLSGGREMIDTTDNVYYFVRIDDVWVIADIR